MNNSKEQLNSVLKTAQMGQTGIRSVLNNVIRPSLRRAMESQLQEYDRIESEAYALASQRGWELSNLAPVAKSMAHMMSKAKLTGGNTDSRIAAMMIQGNTRGMIKSLKNLHQFSKQDSQITTLSQKLLDCETANIRQMQEFL